VLRTAVILRSLWDESSGASRGRLADAPVAGHIVDPLRRHCRQADGCGQENDGKRGAKSHGCWRERQAGRIGLNLTMARSPPLRKEGAPSFIPSSGQHDQAGGGASAARKSRDAQRTQGDSRPPIDAASFPRDRARPRQNGERGTARASGRRLEYVVHYRRQMLPGKCLLLRVD
jgi:hypothetical protein